MSSRAKRVKSLLRQVSVGELVRKLGVIPDLLRGDSDEAVEDIATYLGGLEPDYDGLKEMNDEEKRALARDLLLCLEDDYIVVAKNLQYSKDKLPF